MGWQRQRQQRRTEVDDWWERRVAGIVLLKRRRDGGGCKEGSLVQDGGEALIEDAGSGWKGPETLGQQWPDLSSTAGWGVGVQGVQGV
jgi:hypothetical protein